MRHFTTVCDFNYLSQGLALYNSLMRVNPNFTLYWLCINDKCYDALYRLQLDNVILKKATELFPHKDFSYKEYCWSLASRFTWWVLDSYKMSDIAYLDADLYFYQDYEYIYKEIGNKSIGIVEHRIPRFKTVGKYNVGFVYFKNDAAGVNALDEWQRLVKDKKNEYFETHGSCGDQKYLELFEQWHPGQIHVINCGHGAWWCNKHFDFKEDYITWRRQKQLFVYMHYSHFKLTETGYTHAEMRQMSPRLKEYYDNYEKEIRLLTNKLK